MSNTLEFPLSFQRQYAGPLDKDSVFSTTAARMAYLSNARRYPGQPVVDLEEEMFYIINATADAYVPVGVGTATPDTEVLTYADMVGMERSKLQDGHKFFVWDASSDPFNQVKSWAYYRFNKEDEKFTLLSKGDVVVDLSNYYTKVDADDRFQQKEFGKGLSANDYTHEDKQRVGQAVRLVGGTLTAPDGSRLETFYLGEWKPMAYKTGWVVSTLGGTRFWRALQDFNSASEPTQSSSYWRHLGDLELGLWESGARYPKDRTVKVPDGHLYKLYTRTGAALDTNPDPLTDDGTHWVLTGGRDSYTRAEVDELIGQRTGMLEGGNASQYLRGDKTWQTHNLDSLADVTTARSYTAPSSEAEAVEVLHLPRGSSEWSPTLLFPALIEWDNNSSKMAGRTWRRGDMFTIRGVVYRWLVNKGQLSYYMPSASILVSSFATYIEAGELEIVFTVPSRSRSVEHPHLGFEGAAGVQLNPHEPYMVINITGTHGYLSLAHNVTGFPFMPGHRWEVHLKGFLTSLVSVTAEPSFVGDFSLPEGVTDSDTVIYRLECHDKNKAVLVSKQVMGQLPVGSGIGEETDPVFSAHVASSITQADLDHMRTPHDTAPTPDTLVKRDAAGHTELATLKVNGKTDLGSTDIAGDLNVRGIYSSAGITSDGKVTAPRMALNLDLAMIPVIGGQSHIASFWGLVLNGNMQSNPDVTPSNIGATPEWPTDFHGRYGVIIPSNHTGAINLMLKRKAGQTADIIQLHDEHGNVLARFTKDGDLYVNNLNVAGSSSGGGGEVTTVAWADITGKPALFPAEQHRHDWSEIDNAPQPKYSIRVVASTAERDAIPAADRHEGMQVVVINNDNPAQNGRYELARDAQGNLVWQTAIIFGLFNEAVGRAAFAIGYATHAMADYAYSEGWATWANGRTSHAEGRNSVADGETAHAEGHLTEAIGNASHSQGYCTTASGDYSHTGGKGYNMSYKVKASGRAAFNHSEVTKNGVGAAADNSVILGGVDNNVNSTALRSVVLGGQNITATEPDTVYVPNLRVQGTITDFAGNPITGGNGEPASVTWEEVTGKPTAFTPSAHRHDWSEIDNAPAVPQNLFELQDVDFGASTPIDGHSLERSAGKWRLVYHAKKTPVRLTDATTVYLYVNENYNFVLQKGANSTTLVPSFFTDGDSYAVDILGCNGTRITFGPTNWTHYLVGGGGQSVTGVTLPASGIVTLTCRFLQAEQTCLWTMTEY